MPFALIPFMLLIVPIVEITAFILIGGQIGIVATLAMILVTAIIGTFLLRQQGFQILSTIRSETAAGRIPGRTLGDGAMILVAGILLLTPGFVTDSLGFLLFVPFVRDFIWKFLAARISLIVPGGDQFGSNSGRSDPFGQQGPDSFGDGKTIDLDADEYTTGEADPDSPWNRKK